MTQQYIGEFVAPDISHIVTENDTPVDNFQSAKQQRLLVEPLYTSWLENLPFVADANVGLFYTAKQDPIVPDAFLSLGVEMPTDWSKKQNRSYFVWEFGKFPDICIEIVSNREGNELGKKKDLYARIGVPYYAVFDPLKQLQRPDEMNGQLLRVWGLSFGQYVELSQPFWLPTVGLGLTVWQGEFEAVSGIWLRWCGASGLSEASCDQQVIPTGAERAEADRLAARLRELGINPDEI
ncbi:Uma2 family endonuclease [Leptolyngbya sp. FACHB-17]|uniref:Uma2 family endonuclease n=1 Tax=unclassified Leptolyngbya TaxID=2650499 RepID=UPI00167FF490|nr:Uma2 family endonuclease [Leptolyngbya sp. FACHB-17]MBD2079664.1 Uma2 family endonuclease [Leptolyngbya sp. FACHB-17]